MSQPERIGKYPVTGVLGKGAMGVVYEGFDPVIRRKIAIKTIRKELIEDERGASIVARFRNEAQAAGGLAHPGIVMVYEFGEHDDLAFIAMEYVEGNSLREYLLRKTRFEEGDIVSIMSQTLDALDFAHRAGVWHRDIKPANIIITRDGRVKIADFGVARVASSDLTQHGAIIGTPGYIAPEIYFGRPTSQRVDIFSAGVVLYQLLTGVQPFRGAPEAVMYKVCHEPAPALSVDEPSGRWSPYEAVVARALAKDPADRHGSAGIFRAALLDAYAKPVESVVSEETIIVEVSRPGMVADTPGSRSQSQASLSPHTPPIPTVWDPGVIRQIETHLTRFVGPIARVLVRRGAQRTADPSALIADLARDLPTEKERQEFFAVCSSLLGMVPSGHSASSPGAGSFASSSLSGGTALSAALVERASRVLATSLGPVAKIVVRKAAAESPTAERFAQILAGQLGSDAERQQFLKDLGNLSG
jgi:serine/threonine-protein kinase